MSKEKQNAEIYRPMCEELFNNIEKQYQELAKIHEQNEEIDELTTVLYEANHKKSVLDYRWLATEAYSVGYRKQEWISVDERLPETEGDYLVWNKEQKKIEIRFFYRLPPNYPVESHPEIREYFGNFADYKRITHWMPLPEAPKMKGGEADA